MGTLCLWHWYRRESSLSSLAPTWSMISWVVRDWVSAKISSNMGRRLSSRTTP